MRILFSALILLGIAGRTARADEIATRLVVDPTGVHIVTTHRSGPSPSAPSMSVSSNPNPSATGQRWVYPNPVGMPWITQNVSVGNGGAFAWLGQDLNFQRTTLVSSTDNQSPAVPIYEELLSGSDVIGIAAADKAPVAVVARRNFGTATFEVRLMSGFQTTAVTNVSVGSNNAFEVAISDDGESVVVGYNDPGNVPTVEVFDTFGGSALSLYNTYTVVGFNLFREIDLSGDGSVILFATDTNDVLLDRLTGATIFNDGSSVSVDAHAIDADGDSFGRGGFDIGAWKKNGASYSRVVTFFDSALGFMVSTCCDISADGSTFAAAAYDATNANRIRLYVFGLTPTGSTHLWTFAKNSTGGLQNVPSAVSISDDGKYIAFGSWGGAASSQAELLLFDRDAGNVAIGSINTPGSVFDCEISGDGQFVIAGTKAVHANSFGNGGEGYSLDRGQQGFRLRGTPSIGRSIALEAGGFTGETVLLVASLGLLPTPLSSPTFIGTFDLDMTFPILWPTPVGTVPGGGVLSLPVAIPFAPAAVGVTAYAQAIRTGAPKPTFDNHLAVPITP